MAKKRKHRSARKSSKRKPVQKKQEKKAPEKKKKIKPILGVIYDMDGTLTKPYIDWPKLRLELDVPDDLKILDYLDSLTPGKRSKKEKILHKTELEAAENSELNPWVKIALIKIRKAGIKQAVVTNNTKKSADTVLEKHKLEFDYVITREDGEAKPAPDLLLLAAEKMGLTPEEVVCVGDSSLDIHAAWNACMRFVLVQTWKGQPEWKIKVKSFRELAELILKYVE